MKAWVGLRHCQLQGDQRKGPWSKIWHFRILRQASAGATFQGHQVQILQVHGGQGDQDDRGEGGWDLRGGGGWIEGRDETKIQSQSFPQICDFKTYFKNKKTLFHLLLKAVCAGPSSCKYTDTAKCVITPISSRNTCRSPLSVTTCSSVVDMSRFIYLLSGIRCPWPCAILMTLGTARNWRESLLIWRHGQCNLVTCLRSSPGSPNVVHIGYISSVWVYSVKYSARWVENVFFPTLNYKYILHQH